MKPLKSIVRSLLPQSVRTRVDDTLGAWKSRKFASSRRSEQLLGKASGEWLQRIADAIACSDNQHIPRVPDAGKLEDGLLTMHNGIRVGGLSYCGAGMLNLMIENRGVHEPQEERAFAEVLKHVKPGGAMMELGAYWGFYSLWFCEEVPDADCHLVEPHPANIRSGKQNFKLNHRIGQFERAYVGSQEGPAEDGTPTISVDAYCERQGIKRLAMLHADIQGAELDMLHGARRMLVNHLVDFVFVSTHSNKLHDACVEKLEKFGYQVIASADLNESYSVDGVIAAKRPGVAGPEEITISKRPTRSNSVAA